MTPLDYYKDQCNRQAITEDPDQVKVLETFNRIQTHLVSEHAKRKQLYGCLRKPKSVSGLYLWGGVGIGKTFLMDCFYNTLPFKEKRRIHFHQFMQMIHEQLRITQNKNPLKIIAKNIAKQSMVLCFDEFFVQDIVDALILANLLDELFMHGVTFITTSNIEPNDLYKNGLQRSRFLPAIALIKQHTSVIHFKSTTDYRLRYLKESGVFFTPNNDVAKTKMETLFNALTNAAEISSEPIIINNRPVPIVKVASSFIWLEMDTICKPPRNQDDYLEIVKEYHTIFISNITPIKPMEHNKILLFIRLIDVLYDARVKLVLSSASQLQDIYPEGTMKRAFERTLSRLIEMQSEKYFTNI